ncbi:unnamed protein product [Paramecium pentaurelia]|uniref:Uncharacterized protein n=1 Tax=Paramecium pentaurelia TaxID=43138 RepID=A0A8S1U745_9CILI|nr:unnamed protein product [Paramecium pentaurelia]
MIRSFQIGKDISTQLMASVSKAQDEYYSLYTQQIYQRLAKYRIPL